MKTSRVNRKLEQRQKLSGMHFNGAERSDACLNKSLGCVVYTGIDNSIIMDDN
jgi:hypothetical protein